MCHHAILKGYRPLSNRIFHHYVTINLFVAFREIRRHPLGGTVAVQPEQQIKSVARFVKQGLV